MLDFLRKHTVFTVLMAFVIGWSSAVSAMQQSLKHASMQHFPYQLHHSAQQIGSEHAQHPQMFSKETRSQHVPRSVKSSSHFSAVSQSSMQHCHEGRAVAAEHHTMPQTHFSIDDGNTDQAMMHQLNCHASHDLHTQGKNACSCADWHCQQAVSALDPQLDSWQMPKLELFSAQPIDAYQAESMSGFWLEILRPPQA